MQRVLGHVALLATLRRDIFIILHGSYMFAQQVRGERQAPLWPSVHEELRALLALVCLPGDSLV